MATGDIARRKGIDVLIKAADRRDWPDNVSIVLAGPVSDDLRELIGNVGRRHPDRLVVLDRFLDRDEFAAAFVAADIIWAVTPFNPGVSSTFLYAARTGRPAIVAHSNISARWMCGRIGPGLPVRMNPANVPAAVDCAMQLPPQTSEQARFLSRITDPAAYVEALVDV